MSEQAVSEKALDKLFADAEVKRAVESLRRAVDPDTLDEAFTDLLAAALPELEAEWRERLLSDESVIAATKHRHPLLAQYKPEHQQVHLVNAKQDLETALAATQPHSGQPGDQG